jgi:hypothetical protein
VSISKTISPEEAQARGLRSFIGTPKGQRVGKVNEDAALYARSQGWRILGRHDEMKEGRLVKRTFYYE